MRSNPTPPQPGNLKPESFGAAVGKISQQGHGLWAFFSGLGRLLVLLARGESESESVSWGGRIWQHIVKIQEQLMRSNPTPRQPGNLKPESFGQPWERFLSRDTAFGRFFLA